MTQGHTTSSEPASSARTLRVLVVDDDEESREGLRRVIQGLGHHCEVARDGMEALELHHARHFDAVVADWMMPNMDGITLCRQMRKADDHAYTYFIFTTGLGDKDHLLEGMRAGADDYLVKPIDADELEARLVSAGRVTALHRRLTHQARAAKRDSQHSFRVARIDPLTAVANRLQMQEDVQTLRGRVGRYGHRYCIALCDIDYFKQYNDRYGHPAGDAALHAIAQAIRTTLRAGDRVYRYGGEEFLVILAELPLADSVAVMERVRKSVEELVLVPDGTPKAGLLSISVGVAELTPGVEANPEAWIRRADVALYEAKAKGRNRVETAA